MSKLIVFFVLGLFIVSTSFYLIYKKNKNINKNKEPPTPPENKCIKMGPISVGDC